MLQCFFSQGGEMKIVSSLANSCIAEHNRQLYEIPDNFLISHEKYSSLSNALKLRKIFPDDQNNYPLKISDIEFILKHKENIADSELFEGMDEYYIKTKTKIENNEIKPYFDQIIVNNQVHNIQDIIQNPNAFKLINSDWELKEFIGIGSEAAVFLAKKKHSVFEQEQLSIIKLPRLKNLEQFICNFATQNNNIFHLSDDNDERVRLQNNMPAILDLANAIAQEKSKMNNLCGIKSRVINGSCLIEEKVPGITLSRKLETTSNISVSKFEIFIKVIIAVNDLHNKKNTYHNDLNPDNILVSGKSVRLIDFGRSQTVNCPEQLSEQVLKTGTEVTINRKGQRFLFKSNTRKFNGVFNTDLQPMVELCKYLGFDAKEFKNISKEYDNKPHILLENLGFELAKQILIAKQVPNHEDLIIENNAKDFWTKFEKFRKKPKERRTKEELDRIWKIYKSIIQSTKPKLKDNLINTGLVSAGLLFSEIIFEFVATACNSAFAIGRSQLNFILHSAIGAILLAILATSASVLYMITSKHKKRPSGSLERRSSRVFTTEDIDSRPILPPSPREGLFSGSRT